jgi:hypothetical protein
MPHLNETEAKGYAENYCIRNELRYLSHEYYYHSDGRVNYIRIAVEDHSGRYVIEIDLNKLIDFN